MRTRSWKLYPRTAFTGNPFSDEKPPLMTRIANRYKLWKYDYALFDLENDPGEHIDVHEENFWTATGHEKLIDKLSRNRGLPPPAPTVTVDDATKERLRALGYVN